jgi:molybdate transport system ATP-binding protein
LRLIAGLEKTPNAKIKFDDMIWQDKGIFIPTYKRSIAYVFQDVRLFPHLSVKKNLLYAHKRAAKINMPIEFNDVVEQLDLVPLLSRNSNSLSGGERQRVAIARSILTRPKLLLMDEPLAALDNKRKSTLFPYISALPKKFNIPIIYVTHSIEEVIGLADNIVAIDNGKLLAFGGVREILQRLDIAPISGRFEAGAIINAKVTGYDKDFMLSELIVAGQKLIMPDINMQIGKDLRLHIRSRDVALAVKKPIGLSIRNILKGKIAEIEQEKNTAYVEILIDIGEGQNIRSRITKAALSDLNLKIGKNIFALIKSISFDQNV